MQILQILAREWKMATGRYIIKGEKNGERKERERVRKKGRFYYAYQVKIQENQKNYKKEIYS